MRRYPHQSPLKPSRSFHLSPIPSRPFLHFPSFRSHRGAFHGEGAPRVAAPGSWVRRALLRGLGGGIKGLATGEVVASGARRLVTASSRRASTRAPRHRALGGGGRMASSTSGNPAGALQGATFYFFFFSIFLQFLMQKVFTQHFIQFSKLSFHFFEIFSQNFSSKVWVGLLFRIFYNFFVSKFLTKSLCLHFFQKNFPNFSFKSCFLVTFFCLRDLPRAYVRSGSAGSTLTTHTVQIKNLLSILRGCLCPPLKFSP
ncbi:hypothetical protein SETIT_9G193000v2 [Setaria italica]|uniref:Uncharacterized protein n=1 Tax=Setaria italica TaxID=4555 RepID=A0A368SIE9_SETIT|nr:hypothetical protein SETIT_9G193000v2 [Setaria italica]